MCFHSLSSPRGDDPSFIPFEEIPVRDQGSGPHCHPYARGDGCRSGVVGEREGERLGNAAGEGASGGVVSRLSSLIFLGSFGYSLYLVSPHRCRWMRGGDCVDGLAPSSCAEGAGRTKSRNHRGWSWEHEPRRTTVLGLATWLGSTSPVVLSRDDDVVVSRPRRGALCKIVGLQTA
jgi:hypothetical protein